MCGLADSKSTARQYLFYLVYVHNLSRTDVRFGGEQVDCQAVHIVPDVPLCMENVCMRRCSPLPYETSVPFAWNWWRCRYLNTTSNLTKFLICLA